MFWSGKDGQIVCSLFHRDDKMLAEELQGTGDTQEGGGSGPWSIRILRGVLGVGVGLEDGAIAEDKTNEDLRFAIG